MFNMQLALPASTILILALSALTTARTDISGCTSTQTVAFGGASLIYYVPGTGEICSFLDCGGGTAPPKTTVPGCPLYSGTATVTPSYLHLAQATSTSAPSSTASGSGSGSGVEGTQTSATSDTTMTFATATGTSTVQSTSVTDTSLIFATGSESNIPTQSTGATAQFSTTATDTATTTTGTASGVSASASGNSGAGAAVKGGSALGLVAAVAVALL